MEGGPCAHLVAIHCIGTTNKMESTSDEVVVDMETLVNSMEGRLRTFGKRSKNRKGCVIRRVLPLLRTDCENGYDPTIISIGPLHRNNEALKPMETLKWKYLRLLILRNREENKLEKYIQAVHSVKEEAMKFYEPDELGTYCNWDGFVEMMVLDGCFIIEHLVSAYFGEIHADVNDVTQRRPLLLRDLLLVENQIPFIILQKLYDSSDIPDLVGLKPDGTCVTLMELAVAFVTKNMVESVSPIPDPTIHLLHVFHACLRPPTPNYDDASIFSFPKMRRRILRLAAAPFLLLLSCLLTCKIPTNFWGYRSSRRRDVRGERAPTEIPSATQLYNLGVDCKRKKKKKDSTPFFVDATFDKEEGILEIPMFSVHQASISIFRNLMTFEQMYSTAGNHITSHAVLMSCLVGAAKDVAMLKDSGIIDGPLKAVQAAEVFTQLCRGSYMDFDSHHYRRLLEDVREYCSTAHNKWRADFKHTYFGSPWTVASLIAAAYILLLTSAQTFYAIYAYHHPPSS